MKKIIAILLTSTLLLTGCLKKDSSNENKEPIKIVIWNLFDDTDVLAGQIQAFKSKNPKLEIEYKKFNDPIFYEEILINELAEGNGPDIFTIKNTGLEKHKGKIEPLKVGFTDLAMNEQIYRETFLPVVSNDLIKDGNIYGVSLYADTLALYYNKSFFKDHFTTGKPSDTWSGLTKQVEQLTRKDNSIERFSLAGISMGRSDNIIRAVDILYLIMMQYGAEFYEKDTNKITFSDTQGKLLTNSDSNLPSKTALNFYTSFGKASYKNYSWNQLITSRSEEKNEIYPFVAGKTAMIFGYSYLYDDIVSKISQLKNLGKDTISKGDIAIAEVPQIEAFSDSGKRDSLASYYPLVVSKNSKNPKEAWDFLLYLTSKESLVDYYEKTSKPSSRIDLIEEQKLEPLYGVFARQAAYAKTYPNIVLDDEKYKTIFNAIIDVTVKSKQEAQEALVEGQRIIQCLLDVEIKKEKMLGVNCMDEE